MAEKIVVLSGAGMSAESGVKTFRDSNGLWEGHDVMDVATPEGFARNPERVLEFYNQRRRQAWHCKPNAGHYAIAELEKQYDVTVITQNVDHFHEQAGSSHVIHLHGEIMKARSTGDPELVYDMTGPELNLGDKCEKGYQLRPHIVWFGEAVPMMEPAMQHASSADYFIVVGTSLLVYPAAGLINFVSPEIPKYVIDPNIPDVSGVSNVRNYEENATTGLRKVVDELLNP